MLLGFALGARPIADNSFLVHLRTGIDIVAGRGIPRSDPYSSTAAGARWVVQSWLPAALYGLVERIGGDGGLLVLQGALTAGLAAIVLRLVRPVGAGRLAAGAALVALAIGAPYWSPRPLLVGLLCLGLTILVVREERPSWLLVPIVWVWVSSHGSFPLGAAWLGLAAVGAVADRRTLRVPEVRAALWFGAGLAVACVNPLGPRLLLFPFVLGDRSETFREIAEWRSPSFQTPLGIVSLTGLVLLVMVMARRRPAPWTTLLPLVGFVALGLLALRNLAPLTLAAAAALGAPAMPAPVEAPVDRPAQREAWSRRDRLVSALVAVLALLLVARAADAAALDLSGYPVAVVADGERSGVLAPSRSVAVQDVVGCYLILHRGRGAAVFIDDRYDMYPLSVSRDYRTILRARPASLAILDQRRIDTVLWGRTEPLVALLSAAGWVEVLGDRSWVVLVRPGTWPA